MPELPEVETIAHELQKKLHGLVLSRSAVLHEDVLGVSPACWEALEGKKLLAAGRTGKYLFFEFGSGLRLWFHLGMTGQLLWREMPETPDRHVHLILKFEAGPFELWFRDIRKFGKVFMTQGAERPSSLRKLGPDPFEISSEEFSDLLRARTGKIKSLLMNQHIVSGLGNIYVNESLYRAGMDPRRRPFLLGRERIRRLHGVIREVLDEAIRFGGSSIDDYRRPDGEKGAFQKRHRVYGRTGQACFHCGREIKKIQISGRSSFFCPHCQK